MRTGLRGGSRYAIAAIFPWMTTKCVIVLSMNAPKPWRHHNPICLSPSHTSGYDVRNFDSIFLHVHLTNVGVDVYGIVLQVLHYAVFCCNCSFSSLVWQTWCCVYLTLVNNCRFADRLCSQAINCCLKWRRFQCNGCPHDCCACIIYCMLFKHVFQIQCIKCLILFCIKLSYMDNAWWKTHDSIYLWNMN